MAAKALAQRLAMETNDADEQVTSAFRWALGRRPSAEEQRMAREFLRESPLPELCGGLLNTNVLVYVD